MDIATRWAKQVHSILLPTVGQQFGIHIAPIYQMDVGQQIVFFERLVDTADDRAIGDRTTRGFDMRYQVGDILIAAFRQVDFVANPGGSAFLGIMCLNIVGRVNEKLGWRD